MVSGAKRSLEINGHELLLVSRAGLSLELLVFRADWSLELVVSERGGLEGSCSKGKNKGVMGWSERGAFEGDIVML